MFTHNQRIFCNQKIMVIIFDLIDPVKFSSKKVNLDTCERKLMKLFEDDTTLAVHHTKKRLIANLVLKIVEVYYIENMKSTSNMGKNIQIT